METPSDEISPGGLQRQRERIRRGLVRTNAAAGVLLLILIALALVAIAEANRVAQEQRRAVQAEQDGREKLWKAYEGQARGARAALQAGRRFESLEALHNAALIRPSLELRNDTIASLTAADLRPTKAPRPAHGAAIVLDNAFEKYATADEQGRIQVRRRADDELLSELPALTNRVDTFFPFSPDGRFLPAGYADGQTRLWDLSSKETVLSFKVWWPYQTVAFSPDSRRLVTADENGRLGFYNLPAPGAPRAIQAEFTRPWVQFSPDGRLVGVFSAQSKEISILDAATGQVLKRLAHPAVVRGLAWHPLGLIVATACADFNAYLWDLGKPSQPIQAFAGHQSAVVEVVFHPNGEWLASNSWDGTTRLWDTASGQETLRLSAAGLGMTFSANGSLLAFYSAAATKVKPVEIYEVAAKRALRYLREPDLDAGETNSRAPRNAAIWEVNFSPDERCLVSAGKHGVRVWDLQRGVELAQLTRLEALSAFFHPDGAHVIGSGTDGLLRWNFQRGGGEVRFSAPEILEQRSNTERAAISRDGAVLAYGYAERVYVQGRRQSLAGQPATQWVAVSPDGRWIAASAWRPEGVVRLWNSVSGELARELQVNGSADIAFSPDNRWLVTGGPREFCFLDLATLEIRRRLPRPDTPEFHGMIAFSPDGKLVAVSRSLTQVQLLDMNSLEEVARLQSPSAQLISWLTFSPSGKQLAVATETPFIQVWDLSWLRQELGRLGLDWSEAAVVARTASEPNPRTRTGVSAENAESKIPRLQPSPFLMATGCAVILATGLGAFVLRRNKQLVGSYQRLDDLATQRARDLEAAHRELAHTEKMKALGTLAAGIAHDFNNLLSVIRLSNDVIGQEAGHQESVREEVESIENAVRQGQTVVRSMLGYSREAADKLRLYAVEDVLADTVALLTKQFLGGIVLTLDVDPAIPKVWGAPSRLEQILLNLLVNAAEAMNGQGRLVLAVKGRSHLPQENLPLRPRAATEYVEIAVTDSGPGIAAEIRPRIFEPFFTTKTVGTSSGTGLGLSTVYTIAQQDGLGLGVSTASGEGTTFRVWFPVLPPESAVD